jgi:hypothetical protein
MRLRVVAYAPDALTRHVAASVAERFSAPRSHVTCRRSGGMLESLRHWHGLTHPSCPEIDVAPLIGPVDALIVGAPLEGGHLAAPMRTLLRRPGRIPPVIGVFATCVRRAPALGFEDDVEPLANAFGGPETLILSHWDMEAAGSREPRGLTAFLDRLTPIANRQTLPVVLPFRSA